MLVPAFARIPFLGAAVTVLSACATPLPATLPPSHPASADAPESSWSPGAGELGASPAPVDPPAAAPAPEHDHGQHVHTHGGGAR